MIVCKICNFRCSTIRKYDLHQYYHRNWKGISFACLHEHCNMILKTYGGFKQHIYRNHSNINELYKLKRITCNLDTCNASFVDKKDLFSHVYGHIRDGFEVSCPLKRICRCDTHFKNIRNIQAHIYRKHYDVDVQLDKCVNTFCTSNNEDNTCIISDVDSKSLHNETIDENSADLKQIATKLLGNMYLTLQSKYFLSDKSLNVIIDGFSDLDKLNTQHINNIIATSGNKLQNPDILYNTLFSYVHDVNNGIMRTNFTRKQYYEKYYNFIKPKKIDMGKIEDKESFFYYIPILETLQALFRDENVANTIFADEDKHSNNIFVNISDGNYYRKNAFYKEHKKSIKIILYQDAFEICNPLGSAKSRYKIVGIYMTLGNIPPWNRTNTDQIQLVALCFEHQIKYFGMSSIFNVIINDLKYLETHGIEINNTLIKGTVAVVVGDNLGNHQIGGFTESFNRHTYFCRFCYINFYDGRFQKVQQRNKELHDFDVNMSLTINNNFKGVKLNSPLNELKYFHVCGPGLAPCIAHDFFEGVIPYDLMLCLNYFVKQQIFSLEYLNIKLKELKFKNEKPVTLPKIKKADKITGKATQILYLINCLPFALIEKVNCLENCEVWLMVLYLRKVVNIVMAFKLSVDQIAVLQDLWCNYMDLRINTFPNNPVRCKHHFISHYPFLIKHFGPLRHLWTLRFESKHKYFKNIVNHSPNFKNVLMSLSTKHQYMAALNSTDASLYSGLVRSDKMEHFNINKIPIYFRDMLSQYDISKFRFISESAAFRGISYDKGSFICYKKDSFGQYRVCMITLILVDVNLRNLYFLGTNINIGYNSVTGLYENNDEDTLNIRLLNTYVPFEEMICAETLLSCKVNSKTYYWFKSSPLEYH